MSESSENLNLLQNFIFTLLTIDTLIGIVQA